MDMDTVCPLELDVCGSSSGRTVSLSLLFNRIIIVCVFAVRSSEVCMCVCFCVCRQYMVAIPAVLEAGAETKFCASLLQPNETLVMTVTLMSQEKNTTLLQKTSSEAFHSCEQFQVSSSDL